MIKFKKPNCKCMEDNSDIDYSRVALNEQLEIFCYDNVSGHRMIKLKNNFCPQCGTKYIVLKGD